MILWLQPNALFYFIQQNVLVRRSIEGQLDAVVGDFGLAAKIPRKW